MPDFPREGILFRDITPLLADARAFSDAVGAMTALAGECDIVAAVEARGFLFGAALAARLGKGVAVLRKRGKLPLRTVSAGYQLEYGDDELHLHADAFAAFADGGGGASPRVLLVDDLLATGGTMAAAARAVALAGGEPVRGLCLLELAELGGRGRLGGLPFAAALSL